MRKAALVGARKSILPHKVSLAVNVAPWGVQQVYVLQFKRVLAGTWDMRLPLTPNVTVRQCNAFHAKSTGDCVVSSRYREKQTTELVVQNVVPEGSRLIFLIVAVQPVSFRRLFMQWLPFGAPNHPCKIKFTFNFDDLPRNFDATVTLRRERGRISSIDPANVHLGVLTERDNANLTVRIGHPRGFHIQQPVYAEKQNGTCSVVSGKHDVGGSTWYIKGGTKEPDNLMKVLTTNRPPAGSLRVVNSELLHCVADAVTQRAAEQGRRWWSSTM